MMLSLQKQPAKIASFNPRAEKHGEENVPAGDIKFECQAHSSVLDQFDASYRPFLFRKSDSPGDQPNLYEHDSLTALAKPRLKPLRLTEEFPGYTLRIGSGLDFGHDLVLRDAELSNFVFEPIEGGSVQITFSATVHPDGLQSGELCQGIQNIVDLTLEPPTATGQNDSEAEVGDEAARRQQHSSTAHAVI